MRKSESVKKPKRVRVGSLFTLENDAKSELKRRAKASGVPMSRILDSLVLNRDRLSDEAERVLTKFTSPPTSYAFLIRFVWRNGCGDVD